MAHEPSISQKDFHALGASGFADASQGRTLAEPDWRSCFLTYGGGAGSWGQPVQPGVLSFQARLVTPRDKAYEVGFEVGRQHGTRADLEAVMTAQYGLWARCIGFSFRFSRLFDASDGAAAALFASVLSEQGAVLAPEQPLDLRSHGRDVISDQAALEPTLLFSDVDAVVPIMLRLRIDGDIGQDFRFG
ncbi:MAG TPA: hypothetical protein VHM25_04205 [Polyangiaceae bacterium]|jgi:hypothetical protein|nr:hypothetical protein [Polyangiaceae bacterium]